MPCALVALALTGCLARVQLARAIQESCHAPPTFPGEPVTFQAVVLAQTRNSLHVEFERFGVDYFSITVEFRSPPEWAGFIVDLHYQDEPVLDAVELAIGSSVNFSAVPPD